MDVGGPAAPAPPQTFRGVAGQVVTGVSVVVSLVGGEPLATTVGSLVVASLDPPLLAVFVGTGSRLAAALGRARRFSVNVLGEADHALARRFARPDRHQGWPAFSGVPLRRRDPAPPILLGAVAWVDCAVVQMISIGDHQCYVGDVLAAGRDVMASPLLSYRGRLRGLGTAVAPVSWATTSRFADLAATW